MKKFMLFKLTLIAIALVPLVASHALAGNIHVEKAIQNVDGSVDVVVSFEVLHGAKLFVGATVKFSAAEALLTKAARNTLLLEKAEAEIAAWKLANPIPVPPVERPAGWVDDVTSVQTR